MQANKKIQSAFKKKETNDILERNNLWCLNKNKLSDFFSF